MFEAPYLQLQKIPEKPPAFVGEDRLRMELDAVDRIRTMTNGHDRVVLLRARRDLQLARYTISSNDKRVIAARLERHRESREDAFAVVHDRRRLAVHRRLRAADDAAIDDTDRLM